MHGQGRRYHVPGLDAVGLGLDGIGRVTGAGAGLRDAFAGIKADELYEQQLTKAKVDVANARIAGNNAAIAGARDMWSLEAMQTYLRDHPGAAPPGVQPYSLGVEGAEWVQKLWNNPWQLPSFLGR